MVGGAPEGAHPPGGAVQRPGTTLGRLLEPGGRSRRDRLVVVMTVVTVVVVTLVVVTVTVVVVTVVAVAVVTVAVVTVAVVTVAVVTVAGVRTDDDLVDGGADRAGRSEERRGG